jgi:hypothetical protein
VVRDEARRRIAKRELDEMTRYVVMQLNKKETDELVGENLDQASTRRELLARRSREEVAI